MKFPKKYKVLENNSFSNGEYSIVPIRLEDRYAIMQWRNQQIYHLRQSETLSKKDQDKYFENVINKLFEKDQPNQILFSYLKNEECIGYGGLVHINWIDKNAEISFIMNTKLEHKEFKKHWWIFLKLLEQVAFKELSFHKIYTYAFDLRPIIYKVLEGLGFIQEAILKQHCFYNGNYLDVRIHSKFNYMNIPKQPQKLHTIHEHLEDFSSFLKNINLGKLNKANNRDQSTSLEIELNDLNQYAQKFGIWVFFDKNTIVGIIGFHVSEWDTKHFKNIFGKIGYFIVSKEHCLVDEATERLYIKFNEWTKNENIEVAICKIESKFFICSEILQKNNFRFYECITERFLQPIPNINLDIEYRYANKSDLPVLKEIAENNTFNQSHFFLDSNFASEKVQDMYVNWIESAYNSGHEIVVTENKKEITGMLIYSIEDSSKDNLKTAVWNFAAVDKKFRGIGIGNKLFNAAINSAVNKKCNRIESSLVDKNIISQRLHEKNGFILSNTYYNFHKWYNGE